MSQRAVAFRALGFIVILTLPVAFGTQSCKHTAAPEAESAVSFAQGTNGAAHGHEKLTELAVKMANEALDPRLTDKPTGFRKVLPWNWGAGDGVAFYSEDQLDQPAYRNSHPLTWGSLSADFPATARGILITVLATKPDRDISGDKLTLLNAALCSHYKLNGEGDEEMHYIDWLKTCDGMPMSKDFQDVHFLRRWQDGNPPKLQTGKQACQSAQQRIRAATLSALDSWEKRFTDPDNSVDGERYPRFLGMYFQGLALHTIQDSFSGAHIDRSPQDPRKINKICHYNDVVIKQNLYPNICRHQVPFDPKDLIWKGGEIGYLTPTRYLTGAITRYLSRIDGDFDNLTPEGKGAAIASMSYLVGFAKVLSELPSGADGRLKWSPTAANLKIVDEALNVFFNFDGDPGEEHALQGSGYLNCNKVVETI